MSLPGEVNAEFSWALTTSVMVACRAEAGEGRRRGGVWVQMGLAINSGSLCGSSEPVFPHLEPWHNNNYMYLLVIS